MAKSRRQTDPENRAGDNLWSVRYTRREQRPKGRHAGVYAVTGWMVTPQDSPAAGDPGGDKSAPRWERLLDRWWPLLWAGIALVVGLGAAGKAAARLLWHDELFTLYGAGFAPGELWDALASGFDLQPPLGYLLTRLVVETFGDGLVSARLPSLIGFLVGSVAVGLFVRREAGTVAGTVALLVPSVTAAYDYAYEARPYGALLGASGAALLFWQAAGGGRRRARAALALATALAVAVSLHYYATLLLLPLAAGEIARWWRERRPNAAVWLALVAGVLPLLAFVPLMGAAAEYGSLFWTRASLAQIPYTYRYFLIPVALPLLVFLVAMVAVSATGRPGDTTRGWREPSNPALVTTLFLLALPVAGVMLGSVVGGYRHRYVIAMVLGVAAAAGMLVRPGRRAAETLMWVLLVWILARSASHAAALLQPPPELLASHTMLRQALAEPGVPIVVTNDALYTQLHHYGSPDLRQRLLIVMPPEAPAAGRFQDSSERAMRALARWRSISLIEYRQLAERTTPFFVYGDKRWLLVELRRDDALVELEGDGFGHTLLRVTPGQRASR